MERRLDSFASRSGRHLQRYNNGCRQVAGCIPYRYTSTKHASVDGRNIQELEVLVISCQKGQGMMFPKGGWECNETLEDAALRETKEEAGVVGSMGNKLGEWNFTSKSQGTSREGHMFALLVEEQLETWPEKDARQRTWMKVGDAREACQYEWMKKALDKLVQQQQQIWEQDELSNRL